MLLVEVEIVDNKVEFVVGRLVVENTVDIVHRKEKVVEIAEILVIGGILVTAY